jgi:hypothetical protein
MSVSFPFTFVNLGEPVPFNIQANPDFPTETQPLCILDNMGIPASPDTFITVGPGVSPNGPDPWQLTFHWETTVGPAADVWQADAFLESVSAPGPGNMVVPGFPQIVTGGTPQKYNLQVPVPPFAALPTGIHLFRLFATLRWNFQAATPVVRVAGRAEGPLIEFYQPR